MFYCRYWFVIVYIVEKTKTCDYFIYNTEMVLCMKTVQIYMGQNSDYKGTYNMLSS